MLPLEVLAANDEMTCVPAADNIDPREVMPILLMKIVMIETRS